jgi:hypothetical protein
LKFFWFLVEIVLARSLVFWDKVFWHRELNFLFSLVGARRFSSFFVQLEGFFIKEGKLLEFSEDLLLGERELLLDLRFSTPAAFEQLLNLICFYYKGILLMRIR